MSAEPLAPKEINDADGEGSTPKTETATQWAKRRQSTIYSLSPHEKWSFSKGKMMFAFFGVLSFVFLALCCFLTPGYNELRIAYTGVAVVLLLYRFQYYYKKKWLLFFVELCYVNSFILISSLWICPDGGCTTQFEAAIYIVSQGAVAGATFPLQMPLALHHPEAFETFFLHNSPMWICYAVRYRFAPPTVVPGIPELMWLGLKRIYLPWAGSYWIFMMISPMFPDFIAGAETLSDGFLFPDATYDERLRAKRAGYKTFAPKATAVILGHLVLSTSGFLAAAMSYQYHYVEIAWIFSVLVGCADTGRVFYKRSGDSTIPADGFAKGFIRMLAAWVLVGGTFVACKMELV